MTMHSTHKEENVGPHFSLELLLSGQRRTWELLQKLAAQIKPGMTEPEAAEIYSQLQKESGAERYWHPPKIRFGVNTQRAFREVSEPNVRLKENDIFFVDVGPIYNGYEGDAGQTFIVGDFAAGERIKVAGEQIFSAVRKRFITTGESGAELYKYAETLAEEAGFELVGEGATGHRIGDFPHAVHHRGALRNYERSPVPHLWILEIQLRNPKLQIGAFFEDILC